ncbi:glycosyl hydrolase family 28-related protein [Patescibacteria group bacterium]
MTVKNPLIGNIFKATLLIALWLIALKAISPHPAAAVTLLPERSINWQPGLPNGIPDYPVGVNVLDYGANGQDQNDDTQAIKSAIAAAEPYTAVIIPAGTYYLSSSITIGKSNIAIRGEGYQRTRLIYTTWTSKLFEYSSGWGCSNWVDITGSTNKGSVSVTVASASQFQVGDYAIIRQDNDPAVFQCGYKGCASWGNRAMGQVLEVSQVSGDTLTFRKPLYLDLKTSLNPQICDNRMVERSGVEDLYVERPSPTGYGSNFQFHDAAYCWLKNVWSEKTYTAHVFMDTSIGNEIRGNYFNSSYAHGSGGQGYGIRAEMQSTDNLIEDNIFNHLRHSIVVDLGSSGNVFGYNYSRNPYTSQSPTWLSTDALSHGYYPSQNLFEGNIAQQGMMDNVWGTNGPTTLFRNRFEKDLDNIDANISSPDNFGFIEIKENNPYHNLIGNELGYEGGPGASNPIELSSSIASTITEACNYAYQNHAFWGSNDCSMPASYYLAGKPAFLGGLPWPPLGGDIAPNNNIIPAKQRYLDGSFIPSPGTIPSPGPTSTPTPTSPPLPGLSWEAEGGNISSPFLIDGGLVYQTTEASSPTDSANSGRAVYDFSLNQPGNYLVKAVVNADSTNSNSFWINIDTEPTDPTMIWDIDLTSGLEERTVSWRGSGTFDNNEFDPKVFSLTAGQHTLIIRGREANTQIDKISLVQGQSGDVDGDGIINASDLVLVISGWQENTPDLNGDGKVNTLDAALIISEWSPSS